jgi:hypothetical protein
VKYFTTVAPAFSDVESADVSLSACCWNDSPSQEESRLTVDGMDESGSQVVVKNSMKKSLKSPLVTVLNLNLFVEKER